MGNSALPTASNAPRRAPTARLGGSYQFLSPDKPPRACLRCSEMPDERHEPQTLFFLVCISLFLFLQSHPAQASACRSSALSFYQIASFRLPHHLIAQTSYKRSSGYLSNTAFPPTFLTTSPSHLAQTSYKYSSGLFFCFNPLPQPPYNFNQPLNRPYDLNQPR